MTVLALELEGWMQCRLATDPDPCDEPRGVSGWTFAVAGEPDLDRVIRFQPQGATPRRFGPEIGVRVTTVTVLGHRLGRHPLMGAPVELLDSPMFDGRNGMGSEERTEPIVPFHVRIAGGGVVLRRRHASSDGVSLPVRSTGFRENDPQLRRRAGVAPPPAHRAERRANLESAVRKAGGTVEAAAYRRRLHDLDADPARRPELALHWSMAFGADLQGDDVEVRDPGGRLVVRPAAAPWPVRLTVGVWDSDALCAFVTGRLVVPVEPPVDLRAAVVSLLAG